VLLAGSAGAALVPRPHHPDALARDHGISRATAYRYLDEVIAVLADQAPGLRQALKRAPNGLPLWLSAAEPGSVHDITAARRDALPALYRAAATGLPTLADPGYEGAGIGIHIPVTQYPAGRKLDINTRTRNAVLRSMRCLGERGFALLTGRWRALQHITASPSKIGDIARAALVLTHFEYDYIT
jgi:hypothetical protein